MKNNKQKTDKSTRSIKIYHRNIIGSLPETILKIVRISAVPATISNESDNHIIEISDSFLKIIGISRKKTIGRALSDLFSFRNLQETSSSSKSRLSEKSRIELTAKSGDKKEFFYSTKTILIDNQHYLLSFYEEITADKTDVFQLPEFVRKFLDLTEHSLQGVFIVRDDKIIYINKRLAEILERSEEEMKNFSLDDLFKNIIHPDSRQLMNLKHTARQKGENDPFHYELKIVTGAGKERRVEVFTQQVQVDSFPIIYGTVADVTEHKQIDDALRESEEHYRLVIENANEAIIIAQNEVIKFANPEAVEISGYYS